MPHLALSSGIYHLSQAGYYFLNHLICIHNIWIEHVSYYMIDITCFPSLPLSSLPDCKQNITLTICLYNMLNPQHYHVCSKCPSTSFSNWYTTSWTVSNATRRMHCHTLNLQWFSIHAAFDPVFDNHISSVLSKCCCHMWIHPIVVELVVISKLLHLVCSMHRYNTSLDHKKWKHQIFLT